jgi:ribosomal protein L39E
MIRKIQIAKAVKGRSRVPASVAERRTTGCKFSRPLT